MKLKIGLIIPAAGSSRRHPPNKLLLKLDEMTVIEKTVLTFIDFPIDIVIVVGYQKGQITPLIRDRFGARIQIADNPIYDNGMASSIKSGVRYLNNDYSYFGFCNGDMPFIQSETVKEIVDLLIQKQPLILAPSYSGKIGHPKFFSASLKTEILSLSGDVGGKEIVQRHFHETLILPVEDEGVILDMDNYLERKHV